jgi:hypothetical protein
VRSLPGTIMPQRGRRVLLRACCSVPRRRRDGILRLSRGPSFGSGFLLCGHTHLGPWKRNGGAKAHRRGDSAYRTIRIPEPVRTAIEIARRQSARPEELRTTTSLARLLKEQGRRDERSHSARRNLRLVHRRLRHGRSERRQGLPSIFAACRSPLVERLGASRARGNFGASMFITTSSTTRMPR